MSGRAHKNLPQKNPPWYRNRRGEVFVVLQGLLFLLLAVGPRHLPGQGPWSAAWTVWPGVLLLVVGLLFAGAGAWPHGSRLTPFACPKTGSILLERGAYKLVRHPIYSGLCCAALGWALLQRGWLTLGCALLLCLLFDRKATLEERWLLQSFPGYSAYRRRVRKLIPFLY